MKSIMKQKPADEYPHLVHMATSYYLRPGYDFGDEFGFGLDLILDGIERMLARKAAERPTCEAAERGREV